MDERKQKILQAIIHDYVKSAEPVGSRTLARNYNLGISSATVRNEMFDLEQLGFLEQPHTSAGRIPSVLGYRFYVDTLLNQDYLSTEDVGLIHNLWGTSPATTADFFQQTAKLLSKLSHTMSFFLAPSRDLSAIRFIHIVPVSELQAIMIVVTDYGALDNEPVHFASPPMMDEVNEAVEKLSNYLCGTLLRDIDRAALDKMLSELDEPEHIYSILADVLYKALQKRRLLYAVGTPELLAQPEFKNTTSVQPILSLLEEQEELSALLSVTTGQPITIRIGRENNVEKIQNCSIIQADFSHENEHLGTLAILGPTRMEYGRIIGFLNYMQKFMKQIKDQ